MQLQIYKMMGKCPCSLSLADVQMRKRAVLEPQIRLLTYQSDRRRYL